MHFKGQGQVVPSLPRGIGKPGTNAETVERDEFAGPQAIAGLRVVDCSLDGKKRANVIAKLTGNGGVRARVGKKDMRDKRSRAGRNVAREAWFTRLCTN
jgi:hypothetical protein